MVIAIIWRRIEITVSRVGFLNFMVEELKVTD